MTNLLKTADNLLLMLKKHLGFDHSQISYEIRRLWQFPESIALSIKYHHNPSLGEDFELAYTLHLANSIAGMVGIGTGNKKNQIEEVMKYLEPKTCVNYFQKENYAFNISEL